MKETRFTPVLNDGSNNKNDEIDVAEMLKKHALRWKFYAICVVLSIICSFLFLRYASDKFEVTSTILVDDEDTGGIASEMSAFQDLQLLSGSKTSIINETGVLQSKFLMEKVIKDLQLNISYFHKGSIVDAELYEKDIPFKVNFLMNDQILYALSKSYIIIPLSTSEFSLNNKKGDFIKKGYFGKNLMTDIGEINVIPNNARLIIDEEVIVKIIPVKALAARLQGKIEIEPQTVGSSILIIKIEDEVRLKAIDILDNLVLQYNNTAIEDKTLIAENTNNFINGRIDKISGDLVEVDLNVQDFKIKNSLSNINEGASLVLKSSSDLEKKINDLNSQIKLIDYVIEYMDSNPDDLIPANLGLADEAASQNTDIYNTLIMERNRITTSSSKINPTVINLNSQINTLKQSIDQSLNNLKVSLDFSLAEANNQRYRLSSKISSAPRQERQIRDIQRQQQITESLYLYLLQKREENAISVVGITPNAKVLDNADGGEMPIFPIPAMIYGLGFILGLIIPFSSISIISFLDNKIHNTEELEKILDIPILGDIPRLKNQIKTINFEGNSDGAAEAFRLLRANMNFMFSKSQGNSKIIFVTSTIGGEGKSFVAINLGLVLASNNKKVLLIGADLRKPKIQNYMNLNGSQGLTHYLADKTVDIEDILIYGEKTEIDVVPAGEIPPNPTDLLLNGRFENLLQYGRENYDYVVVDTSPVGLVSDTLLLAHNADLSLYVVRANFLGKKLLRTPELLHENKRLPNMALLLNAMDHKKDGYGYGYGYGN